MIDADAEASRCREEAARAASDLEDLRQLLHENQESEARATEDTEATRVELEEQLQDHGTRTDNSSAQFRHDRAAVRALARRPRAQVLSSRGDRGGEWRSATNASLSKFANYVR